MRRDTSDVCDVRHPRGIVRAFGPVLCLSAVLALPARSDVLAWVPTNLSGCDIVDLQADPRDTSRVWAGSAAGGVFLSTDGGVRFERIPVDLPATSLRNIAIDPGNSSRLYASTDQGLFRVESDGTWNRLRPSSGSGGADWVAVDPSAPGTVVVSAGRDRLERSTDGGSTWAVVWDGAASYYIWRVVFDPSGSGVALAAEGRQEFDYRLLRSTDHGATWTAHRSNALDFLVFDPFGSGAAYADQFSYFDNVPTHVRSRDGGLTWEPFAPSSQDAYGALAVLRSGAVLSAGYGGVFRTDGAGSAWVSAAGGSPGRRPGSARGARSRRDETPSGDSPVEAGGLSDRTRARPGAAHDVPPCGRRRVRRARHALPDLGCALQRLRRDGRGDARRTSRPGPSARREAARCHFAYAPASRSGSGTWRTISGRSGSRFRCPLPVNPRWEP